MNGWLLDTNVVSELARAGANAGVVAWAGEQDERRMFLSILTLGEFDKGIHNLPVDSTARARIEAAVAALAARLAGRVLPASDAIVRRWGRISGAVQRSTGQAPPVIDTLLAATALQHDLCLVTRNLPDVRDSGATVFDPWNDDPGGFNLS